MIQLKSRIGHHTNLCLLLIFTALALCGFVRACPADTQGIRIGEINPLTGKLAQHGIEIHEGILYAVEEANTAGGIHNRPVELISRDDQSQPEVAINQAEDLLLREKVVGLVGGYVDSLVGPISELAARHKAPYIASASLQRALTRERNNPYFFRIAHMDGIVTPLCSFIVDVLRPQRVAVLFTATPGSTEFGREVKENLEEAGIEIPIFEKLRPGSPDFSAFLFKVRQARADILVSGGFFPDHLILIRQLREQGIPLKGYIGPWGIAYPSFIGETGDLSEQIFGMCAWSPGIALPGTEEQSQAFVDGFTKRFGKSPNTTTMHGYTSARAMLAAIGEALEKDGNLTGDTVRREIELLDLKLPMEHLRFNEKGDPLYYRQVVVQIQDGAMVPVYPKDRAAGEMIYPMGSSR